MKKELKITKYLLWIFVLGTVALLVANAQKAIGYSRDALNLCFEMIVPTLFPFFICSGLLIYSGFCEVMARAFRFCMYPLFKVAPAGSSAFVLGIVSGYPLGAVTAGELYANNYLSKSEAERLLSFCSNSGPLFILGSVGMAVYSDMRLGAAMYVTHILAAITVGVLFRFYGRNKHSSPPTIMTTPERGMGEIFDIALQNGIRSILTVCGAVLFGRVAAFARYSAAWRHGGRGCVGTYGICDGYGQDCRARYGAVEKTHTHRRDSRICGRERPRAGYGCYCAVQFEPFPVHRG